MLTAIQTMKGAPYCPKQTKYDDENDDFEHEPITKQRRLVEQA